MTRFGTTAPDTDPAVQRLMVESRAQLESSPESDERRVEIVAAVAFVAVAISFAALLGPTRPFDPWLAAALVGLYALATRIEFQMGSGWTDPSQLVFVPMLFLLPTELVPALVAAALLLARIPEYRSGAVHVERSLLRIGDAWYSVWPVAVLVLAGATSVEWGDWPVYLGALAAQFGFDFATTTVRVRLGLGVPVKELAPELGAIYLVDALLSPIALVAAVAAADATWAFLLVAPLIALIGVFAREREARIEGALTLSGAYRGTAHLLGELLSASDEYTGTHTRSVVVLAHQVGVELGLDAKTMNEIEFGALLHDVGKFSVPNEIINKPGGLDRDEWEQMKGHTVDGEEMIRRIGGTLGEVGAIVRSHHEHVDGNGYPDGLRGEQIPIASRVIAACDAFNAMITDRPYRAAMSVAEAVAELRDKAGSQFDPAVVTALLGVVGPWEVPSPELAAGEYALAS